MQHPQSNSAGHSLNYLYLSEQHWGLTPIILAWWNSFQNPWAFLTVGFLGLLGLHRVIQVGSDFIKLSRGGGYFLEHRKPVDMVQATLDSLTVEAAIVYVLIVAGGMPMLFWLKKALPSV